MEQLWNSMSQCINVIVHFVFYCSIRPISTFLRQSISYENLILSQPCQNFTIIHAIESTSKASCLSKVHQYFLLINRLALHCLCGYSDTTTFSRITAESAERLKLRYHFILCCFALLGLYTVIGRRLLLSLRHKVFHGWHFSWWQL